MQMGLWGPSARGCLDICVCFVIAIAFLAIKLDSTRVSDPILFSLTYRKIPETESRRRTVASACAVPHPF